MSGNQNQPPHVFRFQHTVEENGSGPRWHGAFGHGQPITNFVIGRPGTYDVNLNVNWTQTYSSGGMRAPAPAGSGQPHLNQAPPHSNAFTTSTGQSGVSGSGPFNRSNSPNMQPTVPLHRLPKETGETADEAPASGGEKN